MGEEEEARAVQRLRTAAFEVPSLGIACGPALPPACAGPTRVPVAEDDDEIRVLVEQMARERQRGVRAPAQVARRCPRRRLGG